MFALAFDPAADSGTCVLPPGMDEMEPGPVLAGFLSAVNLEALSGHDRVVVLRAQQRMASHYQANTYRAMAAISDTYSEMDEDPDLAHMGAATEIRAALRLTRRAAATELGVALDLVERLPRVAEMLGGGDIDARRARAILYATTHLDTEAARDVVAQIADQAPNLTTGQLQARIRRLCIQVDPDDAQRRYQDAVAERRVISEPTVDGTANLMGLDLPPDRVAAATDHLNRLARALRRDGETRSMDQLRADVLLDLLCGTHTATTGTGKGVVDIHVDLTTLAELAEHPGELGGYGPVIADIARRITRDQPRAEWRYTVTDPDTGQITHTGTTRRRPSAAQRRHIQTRARTCVFPGCRMPATGCDLDHRTPWAECHRTDPNDMAPFCRHDHGNRHRGWTYVILPNGTHHFTSPLGHTYTTPHKPP